MKRLMPFVRVALVLGACCAGEPLSAQQQPAPSPRISYVASGGLYGGRPLAPGGIFSVVGNSAPNATCTNAGCLTDGSTATAGAGALPTKLAGARVLVNGTAAPLFSASPQVISAQFPVEITGITSADIQVEVQSGGSTVTSNTFTAPVAPYSPWIFLLNQPPPPANIFTQVGAILRASDSSRICPQGISVCKANPAVPGETIWIYMTGLGPVNGPWSSGQAAQSASLTAATPVVTIGGTPAKVLFSGLAPGFVGLYQVNVVVPANALSGDNVPLTVSIGGTPSNQVTVSIAPPAGSPVLQGGGPPGGTANAIIVDPRNHLTVLAATNNGVFKSTNGGQSWAAVNGGLSNLGVQVLAFDPVNPDTVYAGTQASGLFKSTDGGANWAAVNNGLSGATGTFIRALVIDPVNPANLFAATTFNGPGGSGIFRSTDGGANWADTGLTTPNGYYYPALAIDPSRPSTIYAGLAFGVSKSTDGGVTWTALNGPKITLPAPGGSTEQAIAVSALAVAPSNPTIVYAASNNGPQGGLWRSTDGGANWNLVNTSFSNCCVNALAIDPSNSATLYAATYQFAFKSTDAGASWNFVSAFPLAFDRQDPNTLYGSGGFYGNGNDGIVKSTDGGANWASLNTGVSNANVSHLTVDPRNSANLYAVNSLSNAVWKSANGGSSWARLKIGSTGPTPINALIFAGSSQSILYAVTGGPNGGLFKSADGGTTWNATANNGLPSAPVVALAADPANAAVLYAATGYGQQGASPGLFKSTDGGASWTATASNLKYAAQKLVLDPSNSSVLYAGVGGGGQNDGVYKSTDGGATWTGVWNGQSHGVRSLFITASKPPVLCVESNSGLSATSSDGGANWTSFSNGLVGGGFSAMAADPSNPAVIYAGTYGNGLFKSTDGGANWTASSSGLASLNINVLAVAPGPDSTIVYAGTAAAGVFKSTDGGATWQPTGANQ